MNRQNVEDLYSLSPLQEGMLFHTLYAPEAYAEQAVVTLRGNLRADAWERAWQAVLDRHPALRTGFVWQGLPKPMQFVYKQATLPTERLDLRGLPEEERRARVQAFLEEDKRRGYELGKPPLIRIALLRTKDDEHVFVLSSHHLLFDGWSMPIVLGEADALYHGFLEGDPPKLPARRPFRDYVLWLGKQSAAEAEAFWRRALAGFGEPTPLWGDRAPHRAGKPTETHGAVSMALDPELSSSLRDLGKRGVTLNTLAQAAWGVVLARAADTDDVVYGSTVSGRPGDLPGVEGMVGMFINTVPVRVTVPGEGTAIEWLADLQRKQAEARQFEYSPLVQVQGWSGVPRDQPLFESLLVVENYPLDRSGDGEPDPDALEVVEAHGTEETNYALTVAVVPGERVSLRLSYDADRFGEGDAERILAALRDVLAQVAADPDRPVASLSILGDEERRRVLFEWNRTETEYPRNATIHALFEERAALQPNDVALIHEGETVAYGELNARANRLARLLRARGVTDGARVGMALDRSPEAVVTMLAVLKAGAAYVPLDLAYPAERLRFMVEDSACAALVVRDAIPEALADFGGAVVSLAADRDALAAESGEDVESATTAESLAYVIYTSGSTGTPKGVMAPHRGVVRLVRVTNLADFGPSHVVLHSSSIAFDASTLEVYGALLNGARLVVLPAHTPTLEELGATLRAHGVTLAWLSVGLFNQMVDERPEDLAGLDQLCTGGDAASVPHVRRALERLPGVRVTNGYGPTENTTLTTRRFVRAEDAERASIPIGEPISNTRVYVVDSRLRPVPVGVPGELVAAGDGVALGYVNREALTAEKFVTVDFGDGLVERVYRTGDRARWLEDGSVEFLGRVDAQVKLRGFRVEPGEIESVLSAHPTVGAASVIAREDVPGDKRLVAYVTPRDGARPEAAALRAAVRAALPEYMVPAAFVTLDALPLTANGKVDRRALPAPEWTGDAEFEAPRGGVEEVLAGVWSALLGVEEVGRRDSFFLLGGHSLLATQLASRLRQAFGVEMPLRAVFEAPRLHELAARVTEAMQGDSSTAAPPLVRVDDDGPAPASFAQERLWLVDRLQPGTSAYNMPGVLRITGALDTAALERALGEIVRRHEPLRTTFDTVDGKPVQVVHPADAFALPVEDLHRLPVHPADAFALPVEDLTHLPEDEREAEARRIADAEATTAFDLTAGPLFRARLLKLADDRHVLLFTLHHVTSDGWSIGVLVRELSALYDAFSRGAPSPLSELPVRYRDFARWQRAWLSGEVLEAQTAYWRKNLAGAPPLLELPYDHPRPASASFRGASAAFLVPADVAGRVRALAKKDDATLFMALLAAFQLLLSRWSGQDDLVVGTPIAGRTRVETEGLIGLFINTLVLRGDLTGDPTFRALLGRARGATLGAYAHQDVPFERLVEELAPERSLAHHPVFQVLFSLQNTPGEALELGGLGIEFEGSELGTSRVDLTLSLTELEDGALHGSLEYATDLFDASTIDRLARHYTRLLEAAAAAPEAPVSTLSLLDAEERETVLRRFNDTATEYPRDATVHGLFEEVAAASPDAVALVHEGETITYAELNARANRLARLLRARGVAAGTRVGVAVERSADTVVAMLAVLKADGAYVPLDTSYPADRLRYVLEDSGAALLLVRDALPGVLAGFGGAVVSLAADGGAIAAESGENLASAATAESVAYLMYTSGSTGKPKGVMTPHRGIVRLARNTDLADFAPGDVVLQTASIAFDAATLEIYGTLLNGGRLVVFPAHTPTLEELGAAMRTHGVTLAWLSVGLFNQMVDERPDDLAGLRQVCTGGDAASPSHVGRALERLPGVRLLNGYGPTENTSLTTRHVLRPEDAGRASVPIGRPISNTRVYVVDRRLGPVPVGVPGELVAAGDGLALGYAGRESLTAEKFVTVDFGGGLVERVYRTGDRARWLEDGTVEFLGRLDTQVKLRGFRVEPGEIEAVLAAHPTVGAASVIAREDVPGDRRLVAYVTPAGEVRPDPAALREAVRAKLPEYMVPAAVVVLDAIPLTPQGKVDRRALPAPEWTGEAYVAPRDRTEAALAGIFAQVLRVEQVGIDDGFFLLGGHSLLATQAVSRIRQALGVELPLRALFEAPTVRELAARVAGAAQGESSTAAPPLVRFEDDGPAPASFAQERLWLVDRLQPGTSAYNMPAALRVTGALDTAALEGALAEIVRRHEPLRTTFDTVDGKPVQVVHPAEGFALPVEDLTHLPEDAREAEARRIADAEATTPFDLATGPLFRARLLKLGDERHLLLLTLHHVTSDGWSIGVLVRELTALYDAFGRGEPSPLPELPVRYRDFARWQRAWLAGEVLEAQTAYWRKTLAGAPPLIELPHDRPRPAVESFRGASAEFVVPAAVAGPVRALAEKDDATLFMALLAAFQLLLSRWSGQDDVVVGTPVAGRTRVETEGLIGLFINTLVLRGDLSGDPDFHALLGRARQATLGAYAHQDVPFEKLVEELAPERSLAHHPVFQVLFSLQNTPGEALDLGGAGLEMEAAELGASRVDLTLILTELPDGGLLGSFEYATDLFDPSTIDRLARHYTRLLEAAAATPEAPVSALSLLDAEERETVLRRFNDTASEYPRDATVHALFEEVAAASPGAVALVHGGETTSYRELNAAANRLARVLRMRGVEPGTRVGVAAERSADSVVAMLAVLKAGGAYVPLDTGYPAERLRYMLEDSAAAVLLVRDAVPEALSGFGGAVVSLAADAAEIGHESGDGLAPAGSAESAAYLMYTSGSTGKPKGVRVPHRGIVRLARNTTLADFGPHHTVLQASSIAFDAATIEIYGALLNGGRLVVLPAGTPSLEELGAVIREQSVTLVWLSAGLFNQMVDERPGDLAALRVLLTGGDAASVPHVRRALERLPHVALVNGYGPTENTSITTRHAVRPEDTGRASIPIGRPISNTRVYVVDGALRPLPVGVPGELVAAGDGLALGYTGGDELTAGKFVTADFGDGLVERVYRTGDRARWLEDGTVEFLGRLDTQVKLRGYRVELGEVEAALAAQPRVEQAAVVVREDVPGDRRLVAYVTPSGERPPAAAALRDALRAELPEYMVPAAVVVLDAIPLTPHGKVDRRALPAPEWTGEEAYAAPRDATEARLAEIFAAVLRVERVGIDDGFFHLGGHSLLATQAVSRIRQALGVELPLRTLFEAPTVRELAARLGAADAAPPADDEEIRPAPRDGVLLPSFSQERTWFFEQMGGGKSVYNMPAPIRLGGALDAGALERAITEIVRRHESLRTRFRNDDGRPVLVIDPPRPVSLDPVDLSHLPEDEARAEADRQAAEDIHAPFDLERGPLFRARLLRVAPEEHVLLLNFHHSVSDGWSMGIFFREMTALYEAFIRGEPSPLPEPKLQYADVIQWQRAHVTDERMAGQLAYWKERLSGAPPLLTLPTDFPRPPVQEHTGGAVTALLPRELLDGLHALSRREGATLAMTLLAGFQLLLGRLAGQDDVVVGAPIAGRTRPEMEPIIGLFLGTLALRTRLDGNPTFAGLVGRARETLLGAQANQEAPWARVLEELEPERSLAWSPVFQVMFNMLNFEGAEGAAGGLVVESLSDRYDYGSKLDLTLYLQERPDGLSLDAIYDAALFSRGRVEEMLRQLHRLLEQAVAAPDTPIDALSLVTEEAKAVLPDPTVRLSGEWRGSVPSLFARHAGATPDAVAAEDPAERWTYAELDAASSRIAQRLVGGGVRAGNVVAIYAHRSAALVRALLGVLKGGGAFLVLDPAYPAARLAEYVRIAQPRAFLHLAAAGDVPAEVAEALRATSVSTVVLGAKSSAALEDVDGLGRMPAAAPRVEIGPDSLAYLSFTSGTTGTPKAVMGRHGSLTHFTPWLASELGLSAADRFSLLSGLAHDPLHRDVFTPLQLGAAVVAPEADEIGTPGYLARWLREAGVTVAHLTPAMGQLVTTAAEGERVPSLRRAFFVGDVLRRGDVERLTRLAPNVTVVNYYGSTETQRAVGYHVVRLDGERTREIVPLGRGIPDVQLLVTNPAGGLAGVGEVGEVWMRSPHVALGYLNDGRLTAERFAGNPWTGDDADRMYRTGDLGRYLPNGEVEPLGRADGQVKVRGFRVELGEIEAALLAHPAVREAAVLARDGAGGRMLVAYLVLDGEPDGAELRAHLGSRLPDFMVPAAFVALDALPMTANGKLDRAALPDPTLAAAEAEFVAPRTAVESVVAEIWGEVLEQPRVGVHDNFFALGGHSLLATQVLSRVEQAFGVKLPLRTVFERPTVAGLAEALEAHAHDVVAEMGDALEGLSDEEIAALLAEE
ncbi:MAG TPA: amino acid adenylation domain-containing protein [Longimicrobium sp.]|nr:amino acid adenylation domain-containing protein [Longimicrobium sp.]